ncbi:deubiquitinating apoptotic inhibitor [Rhynchophorus ferrugineus]|uniref:deubiquitinating apoptotic inhibitor n=1 Tax=Rhynchophorus ferrugineus TaxID=354439 RepID=UPI003FCDE79D
MAVIQKNVVGPVAPTDPRLQLILRALKEGDGTSVNMYSNILKLGAVAVPSEPTEYMRFIEDVKIIQTLLINECANNNNEVIFVALKALYDEISNPAKNPSPVMSIVLQLISVEDLSSAVKFILNSGYPEQSLEKALQTLCNWWTKWIWTENLGHLVLAFMFGLEQENYHDMLVEVTLNTIEPLFKLLIIPANRRTVWAVVCLMLTRMRHSPQAFHKVIPHAPKVIELLGKDESGKCYIGALINLLAALMDNFPGYPTLYEPLQELLKSFCLTKNYKDVFNADAREWSITSAVSVPLKSPTGKVGLYNLGNTCYMNSILQALYMTKTFRNQVLLQNDVVMPLFSKLQVLFALLQHSKKFCLSPNDILTLLRPPGFVLGHQHDSSEFLGYLLDTLHEQEKSKQIGNGNNKDMEETAAEPTPTVVQQSFGGKTVTVSRCAECGTKSERIDGFRDLQLSFPQNANNPSVQSLMEFFLESEKLCGDNQYRCDACDKLTDGERLTKIVSIPNHLILTLKHFRYDPASQTRTKLLQRVNLESRICLEGAWFDLYAAVVHCGTSVDSGHYYTFARDTTGWYKFNDSIVSKTTEESLHLVKPPETPYILFYARDDIMEPETLPCSSLSTVLQMAINKDQTEKEQELRAGSRNNNNNNSYKQRKNDDPPPPGCGGGGFGTPSNNMFVC